MIWKPSGDLHRYGNDCGADVSYYQRYPVKIAAALWCGVPPENVQDVIDTAMNVGRGIVASTYIRCLEPKCRAINEAIESGELPVYREQGGAVMEHVAPDRRHVSRKELKEWIASRYPGEMPPTLFDEIERNSHTVITTDTYLALQAERDALKARIEKAEVCFRELSAEKKALQEECKTLREMAAFPKDSLQENERSKLLELLLGMAMDAYGYDPLSDSNAATGTKGGSIPAALDRYGLGSDPQTVRKYLREAVSLFPAAKPRKS